MTLVPVLCPHAGDWRGRRPGMCFRKPREARGPKRRKFSLVYKMLQIGRNYGDCKNALGTSFNNV